MKVSPDGMESLVTLSQGDMRRALNILQSTSMAHDEVNEQTVYLCTGQPLPSDIAQIVEWMLNQGFSTAYNSTCGWYVWELRDNIHVYFRVTSFMFDFCGFAYYRICPPFTFFMYKSQLLVQCHTKCALNIYRRKMYLQITVILRYG